MIWLDQQSAHSSRYLQIYSFDLKKTFVEYDAWQPKKIIMAELAVNEPADFRDFARMFPAQFQMLEESIRPIIQRKNTNYRDSISAAERLTVTLRFLATGEWVNLSLRCF